MLEKLRNNKPLKIIGNIIYAIALILIILILIAVLIQRFSNNNIALGGIRIYSVATGSMIPKYQIGDILISKEVEPEEIKIGDDITYMSDEQGSEGKLITHSVVDIKNEDGVYKFTTKGIANTSNDPEISEEQVYGKVIYKPVILSGINKITRNVYAFYFLIIVPIAIIIAKMLADFFIRREEEKEADLEEEDEKSKEENKEHNEEQEMLENEEKEEKTGEDEEQKSLETGENKENDLISEEEVTNQEEKSKKKTKLV